MCTHLQEVLKGGSEELQTWVSLTSVQGKVHQQMVLSAIRWHLQDNQVIRPSQHGVLGSARIGFIFKQSQEGTQSGQMSQTVQTNWVFDTV